MTAAAASPPLDIAALRAWIGRGEEAEDSVSPQLARRFKAMLNDPPDDAEDGALAPLAIHWCLAPPVAATDDLGPDGHPARGGFLPPIPLPRRMWAGGEVAFCAPLRIGETVRRTSSIEEVAAKDGRTGRLCFVTVRHAYAAGGRVVIRERQDIVYRGLEGAAAAPVSGPAAKAAWERGVEAEPPLLFRYSALTFNGHRIHYDRRYCMEAEGYPGLVVHGPLQATLLMRFAAEIRGTPPVRFAFRSTAPLFDGAPFTVNADESADGLALWTADAAGRRAMTATATW